MATLKEQQEQEFRSELDDKLHVATCHIPRGIGRGEKVRHAAQALGFMYDLGRKHAHAEGKASLESEARLHAQHYARADKAEAEVARLSSELSRFLLGTDRLEILGERDKALDRVKEEHARVLLETARADEAENQLAEVREECLDARGRLEIVVEESRREVARTKAMEAKWRAAEAHNDELLHHIAEQEHARKNERKGSIDRLLGTWPGDETDEQIAEALHVRKPGEPWRNRHWPVLDDETAKAVDAVLAEQGALPPERCPDCHREKARMHDDNVLHCARGFSPGLTQNALICYRIAYEREKARLDESIRNNRILIAAKLRAETQADEAEAREATLAAANKALADDVTRCAGIESQRAKLILWLRLSRRWLHFLTREVGNKHPVPLIKRIDTLIPREPDSVRWSHK